MVHYLHFESLSSTNDYAKELLRDDENAVLLPFVISANSQAAGRGRESRRWWTGPGSLAFSLALDLRCYGLSREFLPELSPRLAEVVAATLDSLFSDFELAEHTTTVHEPNDVYVDGKKIAGILIESPRPCYAVIGIGINTNNRMADAPEEYRTLPWTTLYDLCGRRIDNDRFLRELVDALLRHLA